MLNGQGVYGGVTPKKRKNNRRRECEESGCDKERNREKGCVRKKEIENCDWMESRKRVNC